MVGGEGDDQLWGSGRGAVARCRCWVPLQGAIAGCQSGGWRPTLGEWTRCHCWVPLQGVRGEGDDQVWGSGRGAIAGCHCSVLWLEAFFLYIDNAKMGFCYLGSMLVFFF